MQPASPNADGVQLQLPFPPSYRVQIPRFQCSACGSVHYTNADRIACREASK